ncbi:hypothetical protein CMUS01_13564 [Colletotrichum musicola]|uniref:Uncharacterized protein n=1 Tax=Colletotrichum musicola TaxID=2175873 RepID=A0A8H6JBH0_9PEZI|nr:hypothetical protein CMUS01_13564 [Colletotrichum musicola]
MAAMGQRQRDDWQRDRLNGDCPSRRLGGELAWTAKRRATIRETAHGEKDPCAYGLRDPSSHSSGIVCLVCLDIVWLGEKRLRYGCGYRAEETTWSAIKGIRSLVLLSAGPECGAGRRSERVRTMPTNSPPELVPAAAPPSRPTRDHLSFPERNGHAPCPSSTAFKVVSSIPSAKTRPAFTAMDRQGKRGTPGRWGQELPGLLLLQAAPASATQVLNPCLVASSSLPPLLPMASVLITSPNR